MTKMTVSLTGGTGFVGSEVVKQLHRAGHSVRLLTRSTKSDGAKRAADHFNAALIPGDIQEPSSLKNFCVGSDAVIHLVGIIAEVGNKTFEKIHVQGTHNIVAAARDAGVGRFLHMSALGTRPDAVAKYHRTKWAAEEIVRQSGLAFTIFRPSIIYGKRDAFTNKFARMARFSPFLPVLGDGNGTVQPIRVKDVAQAFVRALTEPASIGQTFDLGGLEVLTMNEVLQQITAVLNKKRLKVHLPLGIAMQLGGIFETIFGKLLKIEPPFNRDQTIMIGERTVGDVQPALSLFGIQPPTFKQGLAQHL